MKSSFTGGIFALLVLLLFTTTVKVKGQADEQRKFSVSLFSGTSFSGTGTILGNLDVSTSTRHIFGGSLLYNTSPRWSIEANIHAGKLANSQESLQSFENDFVTFAFRSVGDLNNLLNFGQYAGGIIHPYFSAGMGIFLSSVETSDLSTNDFAVGFNGGPGISFMINPWFDLFAQYDFYFLGTDLVDGFSDEGGSDQYAAMKTGIRFNFGKTQKPRPDPGMPFTEAQAAQPSVEEEHENDISESEQQTELPAATKINSEPEKIERKRLSEFAVFYLGPLTERSLLADMKSAIEEKRRIAEAEAERKKAEQEEKRNSYIRTDVEDGHYIQIRSLPGREEALIYRRFATNNVRGLLSDADNLVIITPFQDTHRVLIGPFASTAEARAIQRETGSLFEGSFVITYPRTSDRLEDGQPPSGDEESKEKVEVPKPEPEPEQDTAPEQAAVSEVTASVPNGQYIQIRSIPNRQKALDFRQETIDNIAGKIPDSANSVWVTPFQSTFRILIGPLNSYGEARAAQQKIGSAYEGAFVITYPRAN